MVYLTTHQCCQNDWGIELDLRREGPVQSNKQGYDARFTLLLVHCVYDMRDQCKITIYFVADSVSIFLAVFTCPNKCDHCEVIQHDFDYSTPRRMMHPCQIGLPKESRNAYKHKHKTGFVRGTFTERGCGKVQKV